MPRSELVILREGFAKAAAENLRLHGALAEKDAMLAEKDGEIAELKKYAAAAKAAGADAAAALEASCDAGLSALLEDNGRMREEAAALKGGNKRLAAGDRRHNGPRSHSSPSSWTAERQGRKAAARVRARQAGRLPPGRRTGHPGVTRKPMPNHPDERRRPRRCRCGSTPPSTHNTETKQMADIVRILVKRRSIVFEDAPVRENLASRICAPATEP